METETPATDAVETANEVPLSAEEQRIWDRLVERGREIMAPRRAEREARRMANRAAIAASRGRTDTDWKAKERNRVIPIPSGVKRFIVARASGLPFGAAAKSAGIPWFEVVSAKLKSDEVMAAMEAMYEASRDLMRARAASVVEASQDEGARPNMVQLQMAGRILAGLDREHFGEDRCDRRSEDESGGKALGGGGFVIKVIGDAAEACAKPVKPTGRALVYTDV